MNTQQRAAMQMALEALEEAHTVIEHKQDVRKREEAITALREALAQPQGEWVNLTDDEIAKAFGFNVMLLTTNELLTGHKLIAAFKEKNK